MNQEYKRKLQEFKEYRDSIDYDYMLDIIIIRYELALLKYIKYNDWIYTYILKELETIINWYKHK